MRKITASVILSVTLFTCWPMQLGGVRRAEASLVETAVEMIAIVVEAGIALGLQWGITNERDDIESITEDLHDRALVEMQWDTTMYAHDHRPLPGSLRLTPPDTTSAVKDLYDRLYSDGGVSFKGSVPSDEEMSEFITGLAGPVRPEGFAEDYKERVASLDRYATRILEGNDQDMARILEYQKYLASMDVALRSGVSKEVLSDGLWEQEYDELKAYHDKLPYKSADPSEFVDFDEEKPTLPDEILTGPGYRWTLQASGQIANFRNYLIPNMRVGFTRQIESLAKFELNEQQERTNRHYSFERAVGSWNEEIADTSY
ncbi:MAG: hypothetical protein LBT23_08315 [Synergistaceae bacterium]|nr:hypothetical protein [Synergistaceae bacterium]